MRDKEPRDWWAEGGQIFFHYGKRYHFRQGNIGVGGGVGEEPE